MDCPILFVSNTSWNLYNFRFGILLKFKEARYRVICLAPLDDYSHRLVDELGIEYMPLPLEGKSTHPVGEWQSLVALIGVLHKLKPAFVFNFTVKANIYCGIACRVLGIPYANNVSGLGTTFIHDSWLLRRVRTIYGFANRGAREVFFQNWEDYNHFHRKGLLENTSSTVLPGSGINTSHFAFYPLPKSEPFTFLMIARLLGDKGVREYVQAAKIVKHDYPSARFLLIGPHGTSNCTAIKLDEVTDWQKDGVIIYLGHKPNVREWLRVSHVLVLPSYREGMPRAVLEAAAMGRPAIVTDVPGCRQSIEPDETGWLCEVKNVESLACRMRDCLEMPCEELERAGRSARHRIEKEFDERIVIAAYFDCLERNLGRCQVPKHTADGA